MIDESDIMTEEAEKSGIQVLKHKNIKGFSNYKDAIMDLRNTIHKQKDQNKLLTTKNKKLQVIIVIL